MPGPPTMAGARCRQGRMARQCDDSDFQRRAAAAVAGVAFGEFGKACASAIATDPDAQAGAFGTRAITPTKFPAIGPARVLASAEIPWRLASAKRVSQAHLVGEARRRRRIDIARPGHDAGADDQRDPDPDQQHPPPTAERTGDDSFVRHEGRRQAGKRQMNT